MRYATTHRRGASAGRGLLPFLIGRHSMLRVGKGATLAEVGVDGGEEIVAVVGPYHFL